MQAKWLIWGKLVFPSVTSLKNTFIHHIWASNFFKGEQQIKSIILNVLLCSMYLDMNENTQKSSINKAFWLRPLANATVHLINVLLAPTSAVCLRY